MKSALITGAGRRVGADLARLLAIDGYRIAVHANASIAPARAIADEIHAYGGEARAFACDLTRTDDLPAFFDAVVAAMDPPEVIINNASLFAYDFPGAVDFALLRDSLTVHAFAPIALMALAMRVRRPDRPLAIFNILDQKLENLNPDYFSYTVGKAALAAATRMWRMAAPVGVRVFGLLPGLMAPSGHQTAERFQADVGRSPSGRAVSPRDIHAAISFFLRNPGLPGQDLAIDGGESLTGRRRDIAYE